MESVSNDLDNKRINHSNNKFNDSHKNNSMNQLVQQEKQREHDSVLTSNFPMKHHNKSNNKLSKADHKNKFVEWQQQEFTALKLKFQEHQVVQTSKQQQQLLNNTE